MATISKVEVWQADLSGARGHEQKNERPVIVWRDFDHVKMAVVIPITSALERAKFAHTYRVSPSLKNGLDVESVALLFQIVAIDKGRLKKKLGELDVGDINSMAALLKDMLRV